ncbi:ATP-binding protein [Brevundimonas sp.]|uniref:sensor histidine kinase n=1 Tax=Brevundimonas sp. TaxID=1871086 RepID=UPI0011FCF9E5|nr:ATP-binding protein [Brevundimonas sp.]TAJ65237.1 MAG: HAMP domain-containing protein [Brevundimonas sp.]
MRLPLPSPSLRSQLLLIAVGGFVVGHMLNMLLASGLRHMHGGQHLLTPVSVLVFLTLLAAVVWLSARVTRPLQRLTESADKFSGAEPLQPLALEGPPDMRRAIEAFNGLSRRISDLLEEKDQMLGALGHDLRTPLASMKIRAASMRPVEERTALFATVDGMERMIEDILTLARTGRSAEPLAQVDVRALASGVVGEFTAQGAPVALEPGETVVWPLRPDLLTRALRNLVDNAVRYGGGARLAVAVEGRTLLIGVEDDGPGLPADQLEHVLRPFARLDQSRNRGTGGAGLGLAIAVSIARLHGGTVALENRTEGGLSATLRLADGPSTEP